MLISFPDRDLGTRLWQCKRNVAWQEDGNHEMRSYAHLSSSFSLNMAWCLQTSACSFLFLGSPWMKVCCIKSITWTCNSIKQIYGFVKHQYSDNIRLFVSSSIRAFNSTTFHWEQQSCATLVRLILVYSSVQEAWEFSVCSIYCVLQQLCLTIAKLIPSVHVRSKGSQIVSKPSNDSLKYFLLGGAQF